MVDIGNKIKELRTEQKMTQSDLAERLGVTKSSISSYENGSRLPSSVSYTHLDVYKRQALDNPKIAKIANRIKKR